MKTYCGHFIFEDHFFIKTALRTSELEMLDSETDTESDSPGLVKDNAKILDLLKTSGAKSCRHDGVSTEHIQHTGPYIIKCVGSLYPVC